MEKYYFDVSKITVAHRFALTPQNRCDYSDGRGSYGMVCGLSGSVEFRFKGGGRVRVSEGDVLLLSTDASYTVFLTEEFVHYTVNFELHKEGSRLPFDSSPYLLFASAGREHLRYVFRELCERHDIGETHSMRSLSLLYDLLSRLTSVGMTEPADERLHTARRYVREHFNSEITLSALADMSYMSVTSFRREWKRVYGDSPIEYRDRLRISMARELIGTGYYSITEVAHRTGFDDPSYFARFYKRHVGFSPRETKK